VNVRRLLISLRREVRSVANRILFENNREATLTRFSQQVNPIFKKVQDKRGIDNYKIVIDTSTTTQADIENKTIRGKIFLIPTKTIEFLSIDFVLTNRGNFISG
jgi:phage tail sheath protein FI